MTTNSWAVNILRLAILTEQGLPTPPPASAPLPTPSEALHAYLTDKPLTTPCGKIGTCPGLTTPSESLHGVLWCTTCGIRLG